MGNCDITEEHTNIMAICCKSNVTFLMFSVLIEIYTYGGMLDISVKGQHDDE